MEAAPKHYDVCRRALGAEISPKVGKAWKRPLGKPGREMIRWSTK